MRLRQLGSRMFDLFRAPHSCADGPMQGEILILSEHSTSTAWVEVNGERGRYVTDDRGRLQWERME